MPRQRNPQARNDRHNQEPQSKFWIVTITNLEGPNPNPGGPRPANSVVPRLYDEWRIPQAFVESGHLEAYRYQPEVGSGNNDDQALGLHHVQLFVHLKNSYRSTRLRTNLGLEPFQYHSEPCRNARDSWHYCGKPDTQMFPGRPAIQFGECPNVKEKGIPEAEKDEMRMEVMKRSAEGTLTQEWVFSDPKRRRYFGGTGFQWFSSMLKVVDPSLARKHVAVFWYYGKTGLGKSATPHIWAAGLQSKDVWEALADGRPTGTWFDGYRGQRVAVFDEFDGYANYRQMLRIFDGKECRVGVKGTSTIFKPDIIFITSEHSPDTLLWGVSPLKKDREKLDDSEWAQLKRRIEAHGALFEFKVGQVNYPPVPDPISPAQRKVEGIQTLDTGAQLEFWYPPWLLLGLPLEFESASGPPPIAAPPAPVDPPLYAALVPPAGTLAPSGASLPGTAPGGPGSLGSGFPERPPVPSSTSRWASVVARACEIRAEEEVIEMGQ